MRAYLRRRGVLAHERALTPVACAVDEPAEIAWIAGHEVADGCLLTESSRRALVLEWRPAGPG